MGEGGGKVAETGAEEWAMAGGGGGKAAPEGERRGWGEAEQVERVAAARLRGGGTEDPGAGEEGGQGDREGRAGGEREGGAREEEYLAKISKNW